MRSMRHVLIYTISLTMILLSLMACRETPLPAEEAPPANEIEIVDQDIAIMLRHNGEEVSTIDQLVGILNIRNECIRVDVPDPEDMNALPTSYLTIWPPDFSLEPTTEAILLQNNEGRIVGLVGGFIWITGKVVEEIPTELQAQLPSNCLGPYLYVTGAGTEIPI